MSAFLWVEDFEGGQYREFAHAIFGRALGLGPEQFPNEVNALREFLQARQVMLATNYVEAARFIAERLSDVDSVVLDIDLELLGEDATEDRPVVTEVLTRWYHYDPLAANEPLSYNDARENLKPVAGYHLFLELVLNRGFPRTRILFCSNHGNHLESIKNSFEPARIEAPEIFRKGDRRVGDWVADIRAEPYSNFRRWVILACREILDQLRHGQTHFQMSSLPGVTTGQLSAVDAENLLETLPQLLPAYHEQGITQRTAFRLFVRTLTQDWDKVNYKDASFKLPEKAFAAVLVHARNWTSHDAKALTALTESDMAFLFLIALRTCFKLSRKRLEGFEVALLSQIGEAAVLDMARLKEYFEQTDAEVTEHWTKLPADKRSSGNASIYFANRVNELEHAGKIPPGEHEERLRQIVWHQLHGLKSNGFAPQQRNFDSSEFLKQLMQRINYRSFRAPLAAVVSPQ